MLDQTIYNDKHECNQGQSDQQENVVLYQTSVILLLHLGTRL